MTSRRLTIGAIVFCGLAWVAGQLVPAVSVDEIEAARRWVRHAVPVCEGAAELEAFLRATPSVACRARTRQVDHLGPISASEAEPTGCDVSAIRTLAGFEVACAPARLVRGAWIAPVALEARSLAARGETRAAVELLIDAYAVGLHRLHGGHEGTLQIQIQSLLELVRVVDAVLEYDQETPLDDDALQARAHRLESLRYVVERSVQQSNVRRLVSQLIDGTLAFPHRRTGIVALHRMGTYLETCDGTCSEGLEDAGAISQPPVWGRWILGPRAERNFRLAEARSIALASFDSIASGFRRANCQSLALRLLVQPYRSCPADLNGTVVYHHPAASPRTFILSVRGNNLDVREQDGHDYEYLDCWAPKAPIQTNEGRPEGHPSLAGLGQ